MSNDLPELSKFAALFSNLLDKRIIVSRAGATLAEKDVAGVATYIDATGAVRFKVCVDLAFIASMGAALALIPVPIVSEVLKTRAPTEPLIDNACEVLNIASTLFNPEDGSSHVKLEKLIVARKRGEKVPASLAGSRHRVDLHVKIPGYVDGLLTVHSST